MYATPEFGANVKPTKFSPRQTKCKKRQFRRIKFSVRISGSLHLHFAEKHLQKNQVQEKYFSERFYPESASVRNHTRQKEQRV